MGLVQYFLQICKNKMIYHLLFIANVSIPAKVSFKYTKLYIKVRKSLFTLVRYVCKRVKIFVDIVTDIFTIYSLTDLLYAARSCSPPSCLLSQIPSTPARQQTSILQHRGFIFNVYCIITVVDYVYIYFLSLKV